MIEAMKTMAFKNDSGIGNVSTFAVKLIETPHADAGRYHVSVDVTLDDGTTTTRAGEYLPTLADAEAKMASYCGMAKAQGLTI